MISTKADWSTPTISPICRPSCLMKSKMMSRQESEPVRSPPGEPDQQPAEAGIGDGMKAPPASGTVAAAIQFTKMTASGQRRLPRSGAERALQGM